MILDTNALSAFADGDPALQPIVRQQGELYLPVVALGEYLFGIYFSRRREDYERWLTRHLPDFEVLDVDEQTAVFYAEIRAELKTAGTPIPENDIWISALTRQHRLPIASRDRHLDNVRGLKRVAW